MTSRYALLLGAALALGTSAGAQATTHQATTHHRAHHATVRTGEAVETRDLNRQQLSVAASSEAAVRPLPAAQAAQEPISRAMFQKVPGGNPLHSGAAGGGVAHPGGPPVVHN